MNYLVRYSGDKPNNIAHRVHTVKQTSGALCSTKAKPHAGEWSQKGEWQLVEALPAGVRLCKNCEQAHYRQQNPLPARVERELELLAKWDTRAAAIQRQRMLEKYRKS